MMLITPVAYLANVRERIDALAEAYMQTLANDDGSPHTQEMLRVIAAEIAILNTNLDKVNARLDKKQNKRLSARRSH